MRSQIIGMLALIFSTSLVYQNCGSGFSSLQNSTTAASDSQTSVSSLPQIPVQITNMEAELSQGATIDFKVSGSLPSDVTLAWSNTLNGNSICPEQSAASGSTYTLICNAPGTLLVTVALIEQGQIVGSASANFTIDMAISTPTPTPTPDPNVSPTPTPSPQLLQGQSLYATSCANCHNPIAISSVRYTSIDQLTAVISGNLGNMHNTAAMQALIMTDATDSANMAALIFALSN